ncbi:MAG: hypothetical protein E5Y88_30260 [Mesorhizobium sp.]|nr:type IIL restriction-modification enzyme MmeI [Mesorhizobium sp.]TIL21963.1 MAG: hypothetical protein E5Y88_30260 [Mesorhizobium sp.]
MEAQGFDRNEKRGENLYAHYKQAFEYWIHAVPNRPRYVVLCNFDQFWIYDFDKQIDEPVDVVTVADLAKRYTALNFLFPNDPRPIFKNDLEAVSRDAADKLRACSTGWLLGESTAPGRSVLCCRW